MEKLFENTQTLTLFLFFFLPGFVSLKVYDSLVPSERRDFSKSIYEVVAYSTLNYALLYPLVAWVLLRSTSAHPILVWVGGAFVLVAFPGLWPFYGFASSEAGSFRNTLSTRYRSLGISFLANATRIG